MHRPPAKSVEQIAHERGLPVDDVRDAIDLAGVEAVVERRYRLFDPHRVDDALSQFGGVIEERLDLLER